MSTQLVPAALASSEPTELSTSQLHQVVQLVSGLKTDVSQLASKLGELDVERNEHRSVLDAISKLEAERKCWRLIGGVLVEKTVSEVIPAVQKNLEGIDAAIKQLAENMKKKEVALQDVLQKYGKFLNPQEQLQSNSISNEQQKQMGASILV